MKQMFLFVQSPLGEISKIDLPKDFDGNLGNFIANIAQEYPKNSTYYVGGLA